MSLSPQTLVDRLEIAARKLASDAPQLAQACEEAAAFFREEFDVAPSSEHDGEDCGTGPRTSSGQR